MPPMSQAIRALKHRYVSQTVALGLFILALAFQAVFLQRGLNTIDGGYWMESAHRIQGGEVPYRDFHLGYTPLNFYLMAGFFHAFGDTVLTYRIYRALVASLLVVCTYLVGCRLMPKRYAWIPSILVLVGGTSLWTRSLALMIGTLGLMIAMERKLPKYFFGVGLLAALAFWVGQEMGVLLCATSIAGVVASCLRIGGEEHRLRLSAAYQDCVRSISAFVGGLMVGLLPGVLYFCFVGALYPMLHQVFSDVANVIRFTDIPYPSLLHHLPRSLSIGQWARYAVFTGSFYVPFLSYFVVTFWLLRCFMRGWEARDLKTLVVLLVGLGSLAFPLGPSEWNHLLYALPPAWILLSVGLFHFNTSVIGWRFPQVTVRANIVHATMFLSIAAFLSLSLLLTLKSRVDTLRLESEPLQVAGQTFWLTRGKGGELDGLVELIGTNLNDGELFIAAYDPALYFLLHQENPLFMNAFGPGHLSPSAEKRTIAEIESNPRIKVLVSREQSPWSWAGLALHDYAPDLDEYLSRAFEPTGKVGVYVLMRRVER